MESTEQSRDAWSVPRRDERADGLALRLGVSPVMAHLLLQRGHVEPASAKDFLDPSPRGLLDPWGLPEMEAAADRLASAIQAKEPVLLYGDYDVDGTTGSVVLHEVLSALGAPPQVHIPDRHEGYGMQIARLERAAADGVKLVISIDNGIAAVAEAALLEDRGVDLIIADHHAMGVELPHARARVHPRLPGSTYGNADLCGAGVAFKLAWAVAERVAGTDIDPKTGQKRLRGPVREVVRRCLAFVAMGTIADVVPLVGENRVIVRHGLKALAPANVRALGLRGVEALLAVAKQEEELTAIDVAFRLAPRLNAAGRMGEARRAFRLLISRDEDEAGKLALELDHENDARRAVQDRVTKEAIARVREVYDAAEGAPVRAAGLVVWDAAWPHGIVGIVAAKLTETFGRPALVASIEGDIARGSGRSAGGVNLLAALELARPALQRGGGHAAAVGFTASVDKLEELRLAFGRGVAASLGLDPDTPAGEVAARLEGFEVVADAEVGLGEVSRELVSELERMEPYGCGNGEPVFTAKDVVLAGEPRVMGKSGDHVSFLVKQGSHVLRTVAFNRRDILDDLNAARNAPGGPRPFEVAFKPRLNRWNGQVKVELELEEIRFPT